MDLDFTSWKYSPEAEQTGRLSPQASGVVLFQEAGGWGCVCCVRIDMFWKSPGPPAVLSLSHPLCCRQ